MYYENFVKLCELNKVTPSKVSKATGVSTATLTSWKKGAYTPKQDKLQKIADYFNVSVEYLLTGEEKQFSTESADALAAIASDPELNALILKFMALKLEDRAFVAKIIDTLS